MIGALPVLPGRVCVHGIAREQDGLPSRRWRLERPAVNRWRAVRLREAAGTKKGTCKHEQDQDRPQSGFAVYGRLENPLHHPPMGTILLNRSHLAAFDPGTVKCMHFAQL